MICNTLNSFPVCSLDILQASDNFMLNEKFNTNFVLNSFFDSEDRLLQLRDVTSQIEDFFSLAFGYQHQFAHQNFFRVVGLCDHTNTRNYEYNSNQYQLSNV